MLKINVKCFNRYRPKKFESSSARPGPVRPGPFKKCSEAGRASKNSIYLFVQRSFSFQKSCYYNDLITENQSELQIKNSYLYDIYTGYIDISMI